MAFTVSSVSNASQSTVSESQPTKYKAPLCAAIQGFSLHAGVYCAPWERDKLEKVARYIARPAVTGEQRRFSSTGDIIYKLK